MSSFKQYIQHLEREIKQRVRIQIEGGTDVKVIAMFISAYLISELEVKKQTVILESDYIRAIAVVKIANQEQTVDVTARFHEEQFNYNAAYERAMKII